MNEHEVYLVGTNLFVHMSHGFQLFLQLEYPYVFEANLATRYGDRTKLGTILECTKEGEPTVCICYIIEGNFRPDLREDYLSYEALEKCLKLVNIKYKGKDIGCPLLGASRFDGNGDKKRILELYEKCLTDCNVTVYDFVERHRDEVLVEMLKEEEKVKQTDRKRYYEIVRERKRKAEERFKKNGHRRY